MHIEKGLSANKFPHRRLASWLCVWFLMPSQADHVHQQRPSSGRAAGHIKVVELQLKECKRELETSKKLNVAQFSLLEHAIGEHQKQLLSKIRQSTIWPFADSLCSQCVEVVANIGLLTRHFLQHQMLAPWCNNHRQFQRVPQLLQSCCGLFPACQCASQALT